MTEPRKGPTPSDKAHDWWRALQPVLDGAPNPRGDRAALARLRRASTAGEALSISATIELCRRLDVTVNSRSPSAGHVAALAAVLAHVRTEAEVANGRRLTMMQLVGPRGTGDDARQSAKLKEIRFRALLAAREDDELMTAMRRLVALAGDTANVKDLARAMLDWSDETRTRWAFDYYGAGPAAPFSDRSSFDQSTPDQAESTP